MLPRWYPNRTDPQLGVFIQKHARAIASMNRVRVFFAINDPNMSTPSIEAELSEIDGVKEYRYYFADAKGPIRKWKNAVRYLQCWHRFKRDAGLYDSYRPHVIHAYIILRTVLLACWTSRMHKTPFVASEQWSGYVSGEYVRLGWFRRALIRVSLRKAAGISAVSFFLKSHLERHLKRNDISVIYNVIEPEIPAPVKPHEQSIRIALVADLVDDIKNISDVLRCMPELKAKHPGMRLDIIGGGRDESSLKNLSASLGLADSTVRFLGRKPNADVYRLLVDSDFLVMNSRFETFSLICAEALRCGKPVVATRCGGPEEIIHEGNGILIAAGDRTELSKALEQMCSTYGSYDPKVLQREAEYKFGARTAAYGFNEWYRSVLAVGSQTGTTGIK
ncbi:MAG: hypothetical protein RL021_984 [Bacteroidota bacterium]